MRARSGLIERGLLTYEPGDSEHRSRYTLGYGPGHPLTAVERAPLPATERADLTAVERGRIGTLEKGSREDVLEKEETSGSFDGAYLDSIAPDDEEWAA